MKKSSLFIISICMFLSGILNAQAQEKDWNLGAEIQEIPLYAGVPQVLYTLPNVSKKKARTLQYEIKNGQILSQESNKLSIVAAAEGESTLFLTQKGKILSQKVFKVLPRPKAEVLLTYAEKAANDHPSASSDGSDVRIFTSKKVELERGVPEDAVLRVNTNVDSRFSMLHPTECNYIIKKMEVSLFREGRLVGSLKLDSEQLDLTILDEKRGDGIQLKVTELVRIDASGKEVKEAIVNPYISFFIL